METTSKTRRFFSFLEQQWLCHILTSFSDNNKLDIITTT